MHILSSFRFLLLFFSFHFLLSPLAVLGLTNVTIDDTYGDTNTGAQITYSPPAAWQLGQLCGNCTARPDKNQTFDGSWHDATYNPVGGSSNAYPGTLISATALFKGSAVYVYCILTRSDSGPNGNTDMDFLIDGNSVGTFAQAPNGDTSYAYSQVVFSTTGLSQGQHNITIVSGKSGDKALVLLDRIVYTTEDDDVTTTITPVSTASPTSSSSSSPTSSTFTFSTSPLTASTNLIPTSLSVPSTGSSNSADSSTTSSSSSKAGAIVGGVIGSLAGIACIVLLWLYCLAKRKREEVEEAERAIQPFFFGRSGRSQARIGGTGSEMGMMESADMGSSVGLTNADWVARHGMHGLEGESVWRGGGTATTYLTFNPPPLTGGTSANTHSPETPTFNNNLSTLNTYDLGMAGVDRVGTRGTRGVLDESTSPTTPDTPSAIRAKYLGLLGFGSSVGSRDGSGRGNPNANASVIERNAHNNVRSEKARLASLFGGSRSPRSPRHQHPEYDHHHHPDHPAGARQHHRTKTRRAGGGGVGTGVSPFSPTPLYTPTPGLNNAVSPTTEDEGSATMSAVASALTEDNVARLTGRRKRSHRERERERERKHDRQRERQRARRERTHNHNQNQGERAIAGRGRALPPRPSRTEQPAVQPYYPTQEQARSRSFSFDRGPLDAVPNPNPNPHPYPVYEKGRPITTNPPPATVPRIAVDPIPDVRVEEAPASAEQIGVAADVDADADADIRSETTTSDVRWHRQLVNMFTPSSPSLPVPLPLSSSTAPRRKPSQSQNASTRPLPVPPVLSPSSNLPFNLPSTTRANANTNANADVVPDPNSAGGSSSQTWTSSSSTRAAAGAAREMGTGTISPPPPYQHQRQSVRNSIRNAVGL